MFLNPIYFSNLLDLRNLRKQVKRNILFQKFNLHLYSHFKPVQFVIFFYYFEKNLFWVESWNIILNFSTFSVGGCWGQPMSFFWKLVDETQISKPPEATRNHNSIKLLILLPLRADLLYIHHYETPCMYIISVGLMFLVSFFL